MKRLLLSASVALLTHIGLFWWYGDILPPSSAPVVQATHRLSLQLVAVSTAPDRNKTTPVRQEVFGEIIAPNGKMVSAEIPPARQASENTSSSNTKTQPAPKPSVKPDSVPRLKSVSKLKSDKSQMVETKPQITQEEGTVPNLSTIVAASTDNDLGQYDGSQAGFGRENETIEQARPLDQVNAKPSYPAIARKRNQQGTVLLFVSVGKNGKVSNIEVVDSSGYPLLDKAAILGVQKWKFEAGRRGETAVESKLAIPIRFELK